MTKNNCEREFMDKTIQDSVITDFLKFLQVKTVWQREYNFGGKAVCCRQSLFAGKRGFSLWRLWSITHCEHIPKVGRIYSKRQKRTGVMDWATVASDVTKSSYEEVKK